MKKIIVLGAGMVGRAMATDLATSHLVSCADFNKQSLEAVSAVNSKITAVLLDVTDRGMLREAIADFDLVVCAVPGFLGYDTLKEIIDAGKNVVDISFFPENSLELNDLAIARGVTAIVDCGVAPGMDNLILGRYNEKLKVTDFECFVGGLPKVKRWPFCYKAPFSPIDVIEEYIRPARYVENGVEIVREALSDCEYVEFENVGTLEAFNTDGLRTIIQTMPHIPNMKEKTLRYPGHVEYIKVLKESGFFSQEKIEVNGTAFKPIDFTCQVLFKEWKLNEKEEEITVMRVAVQGENNQNEIERVEYELFDEYCTQTDTSSMARTTGYTATAAANMILEGIFTQHGVFPPELIGKYKECFEFILAYLGERNVVYEKRSIIMEN